MKFQRPELHFTWCMLYLKFTITYFSIRYIIRFQHRTLLKFRIHDSIFTILPRDSILIMQNCTVTLHAISILCVQCINVGPTCFHPAWNHRSIYHNYPSTLYSRTGVRQIRGASRWIYCSGIIERLSKVLGIAGIIVLFIYTIRFRASYLIFDIFKLQKQLWDVHCTQ